MVSFETTLTPAGAGSRSQAGGSDLASRSITLDGSLAKRASAFLLDLYAMSRTSDIDRFQSAALLRLRSELPFSSAFWGMMRTSTQGGPQLHSIFADALPDDFVRDWETVKHGDELAAMVLSRIRLLDQRTAGVIRSSH